VTANGRMACCRKQFLSIRLQPRGKQGGSLIYLDRYNFGRGNL